MSEKRPIRVNNFAILPDSGIIHQVVGASRSGFDPSKQNTIYTEQLKYDEKWQVGDFEIIPNGPDNLFPYNFKELLDKNNIFHSILREKIDLLLAGGIMLYTEKIENNKVVKIPVLDNEISDWLDSWDFENWLLEQTTDFIYLENNASLMVNNKARRIPGYENKRRISEIRYLPIEDIRMGPYDANGRIKNYFQANWNNPQQILAHPAYNRTDPFATGTSVFFVKMPTFGSKYYGRPPFIGITEYLKLKELIINWSIDNLKHTSFKWHVQSPFSYWQNVQASNGWDEKQLQAYEDKVLAGIDRFLASETGQNASKRFHSKFGIDPDTGKPTGWLLTALEDNTEKNSKAYLDASGKIDESIIASAHIDPSLANIQITGKLSSGLDKLIAFNIHQVVSTPTPRKLILQPVQTAININWPGKRLKIGFNEMQLEYAQKAISNVSQKQEEK